MDSDQYINKITPQELSDIGFELKTSPFSGNLEWGIGKTRGSSFMEIEFDLPIIIYDKESSIAKFSNSEFNNISKEVNNSAELIIFCNSIKWLYDISDKSLKVNLYD